MGGRSSSGGAARAAARNATPRGGRRDPRPCASRPGARAASMRDVAQLAGVSHQTVSRVINDHPNIRDTTRQRVLDAMGTLHYRPNRAARALVRARSRTLGVLSTTAAALYGPVSSINAVQGAARDAGYYLAVAQLSELNAEGIAGALDHLVSQGGRGHHRDRAAGSRPRADLGLRSDGAVRHPPGRRRVRRARAHRRPGGRRPGSDGASRRPGSPLDPPHHRPAPVVRVAGQGLRLHARAGGRRAARASAPGGRLVGPVGLPRRLRAPERPDG